MRNILLSGILLVAVTLFFIRIDVIYFQRVDLARIISHNNNKIYYLYLAICLSFFFLINKLSHGFNTGKPGFLFIIVVSLSIKIWWFYNFPLSHYYDMNSIIAFAKELAAGSKNVFAENSYLRLYPHQIPITVFYSFFVNCFPFELTRTAQFLNIVNMLLIQILIAFIVWELAGLRKAKQSLIISTAFLPFSLYIVHAYSDIPATMLYLLSTLFYILYKKNKHVIFLSVFFLSFAVANLLRPIGLIFCIAIVLNILMEQKTDPIVLKKNFYFIVFLLLMMHFPAFILKGWIKNQGYVESIEALDGLGKVYIVAMGLNKGQDGQTPGFFYPYVELKFKGDKEAFNKEMKNEIFHLINNFAPMSYLKHLYCKLLFQFGDGKFETDTINNINVNLVHSPARFSYATAFQSLLQRQSIIAGMLTNYMQAFWHALLVYLVVTIWRRSNSNMFREARIIVLFILGNAAYFLIGETSPHYSFIVLPHIIVLLCATGPARDCQLTT